MALNLLNLIQDQLGGDILSKASSFLGESEGNTKTALGAALPAILGGIMQSASSESGATSLLGMLDKGGHDGSIFAKIGGLLGGGDTTTGFLNSGGSILKSILGNKLGSIAGAIASIGGIGKGSANSLLSIAAPIVMGMIGKQVTSQGLNTSGLMSLLSGQKDHVSAALPAQLSDALGFANYGISNATNTEPIESGKSLFGKLMPWLIALIALVAIAFGIRSCGGTGVDVIDKAADTVLEKTDDVTNAATKGADAVVKGTGDVLEGAADAAKDVAGAAKNAGQSAVEIAKNAGQILTKEQEEALAKMKTQMVGVTEATRSAVGKLTLMSGSVSQQIANWMKTGRIPTEPFTFRHIEFESGSANLSTSTMKEIDELAKFLETASTMHLRIDGYTDNVGDKTENEKLSLARSQAVKKALVARGVASERLKTEGWGPQAPRVPNDTEEGRARNRRIEVVFMRL